MYVIPREKAVLKSTTLYQFLRAKFNWHERTIYHLKLKKITVGSHINNLFLKLARNSCYN